VVSRDVEVLSGLNVGEGRRQPSPATASFGLATDTAEYPPIADYALIGDCRTAALVSRQGSIDWLCLPDFSSPSIFAALLDRRRGGRFAIRPRAPFKAKRRYVEDTNVLETQFTTSTGRFRVTDFVALSGIGKPGLDPEFELVRIVEGLEGETEIEVLFEPCLDYGRVNPCLVRHGTLGWFCERKGEAFLLRDELDLDLVENGTALRSRITLEAAEKRRVSLVYAKHDVLVIPSLGASADRRLTETTTWWRVGAAVPL
jgi:GH15 family glucan-1,4-alpha-glucosidase